MCDLFVGLGEPDRRIHRDELRDRLRQRDGGQGAVLVDGVHGDRPGAGGQDSKPAGASGLDRTQIGIEVEIADVTEELRQVIRPGCRSRLPLFPMLRWASPSPLFVVRARCLASSSVSR